MMAPQPTGGGDVVDVLAVAQVDDDVRVGEHADQQAADQARPRRGCGRRRGCRRPCLNGLVRPSQFHDIHTSDEATTPMIMAPKLLTKPAAGVIPTRPTIMPLTAPRKVGLRSRLAKMSQITQVSSATAVARLVLSTASDALAPAKYGSPPLNPFQPSHRMPAPTAAIGRLFGTARSRSRASRGPITAAATNPVVPAARWITYPPE